MAYNSLYSTPAISRSYSEVGDTPTFWSEILLEELRTVVQIHSPPRQTSTYGYLPQAAFRMRLRGFSRFLWLAIFLVLGIWWSLSRGLNGKENLVGQSKVNEKLELDGLQFIEASHPYIRVQ